MRIGQAADFLPARDAAHVKALSDLIPTKLINTLLGEGRVAPQHR